MNYITSKCSPTQAINGQSEHKFKMEFLTAKGVKLGLAAIYNRPRQSDKYYKTGSISWKR